MQVYFILFASLKPRFFAPLRDPWLQVCSLFSEICFYHAYHFLGLRIRLLCGWTYFSS